MCSCYLNTSNRRTSNPVNNVSVQAGSPSIRDSGFVESAVNSAELPHSNIMIATLALMPPTDQLSVFGRRSQKKQDCIDHDLKTPRTYFERENQYSRSIYHIYQFLEFQEGLLADFYVLEMHFHKVMCSPCVGSGVLQGCVSLGFYGLRTERPPLTIRNKTLIV